MPLSEHEQRMLDQMEQALSQEDPKFASQMRSTHGPRRGRLMLAVVGMSAGLGLALVGVMNNLIWLGVAGFVVMVAVAAWAFSGSSAAGPLGAVQDDGSVRPAGRKVSRRGRGGKSAGRSSSGTFMQRLEQRWERRRYDQW